jgi:YD repeat-containing protein
VFVRFDARGNPVGKPVPVLKSFLAGEGETHGRPTWVAWDKTGALLVSDDTANIIWRVASRDAAPSAAPQRTHSARMPAQTELRGSPGQVFGRD